MAKEIFDVKLSPREVIDIIDKNVDVSIIDIDENYFDNNKVMLIASCFRYYIRASGYIPLIIICESLEENTKVKVISTGLEQDDVLDFGAGKHCMKTIKKALENYMIKSSFSLLTYTT